MTVNSLNDYSTTPSNNTNIAGVNIAVGCPPSDVGYFMRTIMSQIAYAVQGTGGPTPTNWFCTTLNATTVATTNCDVETVNATTMNVSGEASFNNSGIGLAVNNGVAEFNGVTTVTGQTGYLLNSSGTTPYTGSVSYSLSAQYTVSASSFFAASDRRLKSEIKTIPPERGLEFVKLSRPTTFVMGGQRRAGFIAQEQITAGFEEYTIVPKRGMEADSEGSPADAIFTLSPGDREAYLTAFAQWAVAQISLLSDRVSALEGKNL